MRARAGGLFSFKSSTKTIGQAVLFIIICFPIFQFPLPQLQLQLQLHKACKEADIWADSSASFHLEYNPSSVSPCHTRQSYPTCSSCPTCPPFPTCFSCPTCPPCPWPYLQDGLLQRQVGLLDQEGQSDGRGAGPACSKSWHILTRWPWPNSGLGTR